MGQFGHHASHARGIFIDSWGDGPLLIRHGKRKWLFEFSDMFGPTVLKQNGDPHRIQPISEKDPFWVPFQLWIDGGKKNRSVRSKRGRLIFKVCHVPKAGLP